MKLEEIIKREEDLFPKHFTNYEERDFGILFYNEENKTSYDSNHAVIYKEKINDLGLVLEEVKAFYKSKGIHPSIYQSFFDEDYFTANEAVFNKHDFNIWIEEPAKIMVLLEDNELEVKDVHIELLESWDERVTDHICRPSDEMYEVEVLKRNLLNENGHVFVAYEGERAVAVLHMHLGDHVCRFDYILVSSQARGRGYGKALLNHVVNYCYEWGIKNCYQWPAHEVSEKICYQAGFRHFLKGQVGRASYVK